MVATKAKLNMTEGLMAYHSVQARAMMKDELLAGLRALIMAETMARLWAEVRALKMEESTPLLGVVRMMADSLEVGCQPVLHRSLIKTRLLLNWSLHLRRHLLPRRESRSLRC